MKKNRVETMQLLLWTLTVLIQMSVVKCLEVRAATQQTEITIRYDIKDSPDACTIPENQYEDEQGVQYELDRWSPILVTMPSITRTVQKEVTYEQTEGMAELPPTIEVPARDSERGQTVTAVCHIEKQEVIREEWQDGFVFPVTFHTYEAGYYQLADRLIPYNEERPELEGCEALLLELAGVPPEDYRVDDVQWAGDAYRDADGILCRDAAASGQRRMRDYRVWYSGTVVFPERTGWQTVAVYRLPETEAATQAQTSNPTQEETEPLQIIPSEQEQQPLSLWERITLTLMATIGIGAILFLGGLFLLAILRVVKILRSCYNRKK